MKILYGIQGTGNGHITRARVLIPALRVLGASVDILLSGRPAESAFGADALGPISYRQGLSFVMDHGKIHPLKTVLNLPLRQLQRDINELNVKQYDLVISDFEPIVAWAARKAGVPSIGIGHQYAFRHDVPKYGINIPSRAVLRYFAPVDCAVGLHWHSFGQPVLPPIIDDYPAALECEADLVLVYLPFEDTETLIALFKHFPKKRFHIYCDVKQQFVHDNVVCCPFSRDNFREDLLQCNAVICGAGFELPAEAIVLGKRLLVQPLRSQFEQESNALALQRLHRATVMRKPDIKAVKQMLNSPQPARIRYPDVAQALAQWCISQDREPLPELATHVWRQTVSLDRNALNGAESDTLPLSHFP